MGLPLAGLRQIELRPITSRQATSQSLLLKLALPLPLLDLKLVRESQTISLEPPNLLPLAAERVAKILSFDTECVAAGFEDPAFVPAKIICVAWSWVGQDNVDSRISTPMGVFGNPSLRRDMLAALLEQIGKAEMLTGHNIDRHDLPRINAECMRLGLQPVRHALVQDTMRLCRSLGFKKGQDNLGVLFKSPHRKLALNWQEWENAYDEDGWETVRKRCESDVIGQKFNRQILLDLGYLRPPSQWIGMR